MKKLFIITITLWGISMATLAQAQKQNGIEGVAVEKLSMERNGQYLAVGMTLNLRDLKVDGNRAVLLTPRLINGKDSVDLQSVGIYGRRRYYFYVRNGESMLTGKDERSFKAKDKPDSISYHDIVDYADWMNGADLYLYRSDYGCCNTLQAEQEDLLGHHTEAFFPELVYVRPQAEIAKSRSLEGRAFIDFPVSKTTIYPNYRSNAAELRKIRTTIDSVRDDRDISITSVWLKGYASPESPYANNKRLAMGRTEALKAYIQQQYHFDSGIIATDYEPEDWAGLRRYVEQSDLEHRTEILALIDGDLSPDDKEAILKRTYPKEYRLLLNDCYPALRHTDYRIAYTIRTYTDVEEIKRILRERPQKLGLNEFYLAAQAYEPGTDEFTEVFETAVRMYPTDTVANLNAANTAIRRDNFNDAERYLKRAGDSAEAIYARAALAIRRKDYEEARRYLNQAKALGLKQAEITLEQLDK